MCRMRADLLYSMYFEVLPVLQAVAKAAVVTAAYLTAYCMIM